MRRCKTTLQRQTLLSFLNAGFVNIKGVRGFFADAFNDFCTINGRTIKGGRHLCRRLPKVDADNRDYSDFHNSKENKMNVATILAAGQGKRFGADVPKQFIEVLSKPVLAYTMETDPRLR